MKKSILITLLIVLTHYAFLTSCNNSITEEKVIKEVLKLVSSVQNTKRKEGKELDFTQESPKFSMAEGGHLRSLSAPPFYYFPVRSAVPDDPEATARNFLSEQAIAFGIESGAVAFEKLSIKTKGNRRYVRFQQTYAGLPVFGAEIIVQLNADGGVESVLSDIMRETEELDVGNLSVIPSISEEDAQRAAIEFFSYERPGLELEASRPILMIYEPSVVGEAGPTRLVWQTVVISVGELGVNELVLVDAHNSEAVLQFSQIYDALYRQIYDAGNIGLDVQGDLVRVENDPETGETDVDLAYEFLGDSYNFYFSHHERDSIDDNGQPLIAHVRYCDGNKKRNPNQLCPKSGAYWNSFREKMYFGEDWVADDIVGHELTHGVTHHTSKLRYINQSGAISEAFSDIWGEFIDLENDKGTDTPGVKWLLGEDLPWPFTYLRNMANPPDRAMPDRMSSSNFYKGNDDNGGVHHNSGVGSKLAYLLTDGDNFNGYTISEMGISKVADLFYEVQTHLLNSASDYPDLYTQLSQAAINLEWTTSERENLENACQAVEIMWGFAGIQGDNLTQNELYPVYIDIGVPNDGNYYVRVYGDGIIPKSPQWRWNSNDTQLVTLIQGQRTTFTLWVEPDSSSEMFQFWLYKEVAPYIFFPIAIESILLEAQETDTTPPTINGHSSGTSRDTNIYITFSEDIDDTSLNNTNIMVSGTSSGNHEYTLSFDHFSYELQINPISDFQYGENILVTIGTGINDLAGNNLIAPYTFSFNIRQSPGSNPSSIIITQNLSKYVCNPYDGIQVYGNAKYNNNEPLINGTVEIKYFWNGLWMKWTASIDSSGNYERYIVAPGSGGNYPIDVEVSDGIFTGINSQTLNVQEGGSGTNYDFVSATTSKNVDEYYNPIDPTIYFRGNDPQVLTLVHLRNVYLNNQMYPITVRWEYYRPDGQLYGDVVTHIIPPTDPGNYYTDYYAWGAKYIAGWGMADIEGRWNCKIYIDDGDGFEFIEEKAFTIRYEFDEHRMSKNVQTNEPYNYINETNIFNINDTRAFTWMRVNNLSDGLEVRWDFYNPEGSLYRTFELDPPVPDPGMGNPYEYYNIWGYILINGNQAEYQCGDWYVNVYLKNYSGDWGQPQYTDYFRIQEDIAPEISISVPSSPIETQAIQINISASDNNHLQKVILHWDDGSERTQIWDNIDSSQFNTVNNIGSSFTGGQQIECWAEAWDESGNYTENNHQTFIIQEELVTAPTKPVGDFYLNSNQIGNFSTGSSTTNLNHNVLYQIDWGDGTQSSWGSSNQSQSWPSEGNYYLKARAQCQIHTNRISVWSSTLLVTVDSTSPSVNITTNNGTDFTTIESQLVLEGVSYDPEPSSGLTSISVNTGDINDGTLSNWRYTVTLSEGSNQIIINSTDGVGNVGSDTINITMELPVLSPTTGVDANDGLYTDRVEVSWDGVSGASYYSVYRNTSDDTTGASALGSWQAGLTYEDMTAIPGTTYYYWVKAATSSSGDRASDFSNSNSGWRALSPTTGVDANDGLYTDRVEVSWDGVSGASYYRVYRNTSDDTTGASALGGWQAELTYEDMTAISGTTYYYWVKAATSSSGAKESRYSLYDTGYKRVLVIYKPIANAGNDQTVNEGDIVNLDAKQSYDSDGIIISYNWEQLSGTVVTLYNVNNVIAYFIAPNVSKKGDTLTFQLTISDDDNLVSTDMISIHIKDIEEIDSNNKSRYNCFIATATYGSALEKEVVILRQFRDTYLLTNRFGKIFVSIYYKHSPLLAKYIDNHEIMKTLVRISLSPLVGISYFLIKTTLLQKLVIIILYTFASIFFTVIILRKKQLT